MTAYARVRGLIRGLNVLQALNASEGGQASVIALSRATGLHRTTVHRLMETLIAEGYVIRSASDGSYRLTLKVRALSEGFTDDEWIAMNAAPVMIGLQQKVVWPSDLATPDGDALVIRETTHRLSPLSFHRAMAGRRLPILQTAVGRAYFAYCGDEERGDIVRLLCALNDNGQEGQTTLARDDVFIRNLVRQTHDRGYAFNAGDWPQERKIGAVAVPVWRGDKVLGALSVVYLHRVVSVSDAERQYVPVLKQAAASISQSLTQPHAPLQAAGKRP